MTHSCEDCGAKWWSEAEYVVVLSRTIITLVCKSCNAEFQYKRCEEPKAKKESYGVIVKSILRKYEDQLLRHSKALFKSVLLEKKRQYEKWRVQTVTLPEWLMFLTAEVGELADAIKTLESAIDYYEGNLKTHVYDEAIQVATLALKIAEMVGIVG